MFQNIDVVGAMSGMLALAMAAGWWWFTATRRLGARYPTESVVRGTIKLAGATPGLLQANQEHPVVGAHVEEVQSALAHMRGPINSRPVSTEDTERTEPTHVLLDRRGATLPHGERHLRVAEADLATARDTLKSNLVVAGANEILLVPNDALRYSPPAPVKDVAVDSGV